MDLTATTLIERARLRGWLPDSPDSASDEEILALMTAECRLGIAALIKTARGAYATERATLTTSSSGVELPAAASAQNLVCVEYLSGTYHRLGQMAPEAEADTLGASAPTGWFLSGSRLFVTPTAWSGTVRVTYQALAPTLVGSAEAVQIATVASSTTVTVAANPTDWGTSLTLDVTRNRPGAETLARSKAVTRSSTTYTFPSTSGFSAGDWLSLEGESALPQIPVELLDLLALRVAADLAAGSGGANAGNLQALAKKAQADAQMLIAPRGQTAVPIVQRYAPGTFRGRGRW